MNQVILVVIIMFLAISTHGLVFLAISTHGLVFLAISTHGLDKGVITAWRNQSCFIFGRNDVPSYFQRFNCDVTQKKAIPLTAAVLMKV